MRQAKNILASDMYGNRVDDAIIAEEERHPLDQDDRSIEDIIGDGEVGLSTFEPLNLSQHSLYPRHHSQPSLEETGMYERQPYHKPKQR